MKYFVIDDDKLLAARHTITFVFLLCESNQILISRSLDSSRACCGDSLALQS